MDAGQIVIVTAAVALGFFAKGVAGIGGSIVAIPVLSAFMGVEFAVAVMAIPALAANTWMIWAHRQAAGSVNRYLLPLLVAGAIGVVGGTLILVSVPEQILSLTVALFVIAYIVWYSSNVEFRLSEQLASRLTIPVGLVGGGLQGATGISAPVIVTFIHSLRLPRRSFLLAITVPFQVMGIVQVISMAALGVYDQERLVAAVVAAVPVMIVLPVATRFGGRLSQQTFEKVVLLLLAVVAVRLIWSVFG